MITLILIKPKNKFLNNFDEWLKLKIYDLLLYKWVNIHCFTDNKYEIYLIQSNIILTHNEYQELKKLLNNIDIFPYYESFVDIDEFIYIYEMKVFIESKIGFCFEYDTDKPNK